jgi:hypothetical protein
MKDFGILQCCLACSRTFTETHQPFQHIPTILQQNLCLPMSAPIEWHPPGVEPRLLPGCWVHWVAVTLSWWSLEDIRVGWKNIDSCVLYIYNYIYISTSTILKQNHNSHNFQSNWLCSSVSRWYPPVAPALALRCEPKQGGNVSPTPAVQGYHGSGTMSYHFRPWAHTSYHPHSTIFNKQKRSIICIYIYILYIYKYL